MAGEPPSLGLKGTVKDDDFRCVFDGFRPGPDGSQGAALVQNAGHANRQPGWDLTFSAPKDVSVLWSQAEDEETRQTIEQCFLAAVRQTLTHIENTIAYSRTGHAGRGQRQKVDLTVAIFRQTTSRAGDPQLHAHCPVMNVGIDSQGTTRTLISKLFYQHKMIGGGFFRAALARELEDQLGTRAHRVGNSFGVDDVPQWMGDHFSKRRKQVLAEMAKKGMTGAKAAAVAVTRQPPQEGRHSRPLKERLENWRGEIAAGASPGPLVGETQARQSSRQNTP